MIDKKSGRKVVGDERRKEYSEKNEDIRERHQEWKEQALKTDWSEDTDDPKILKQQLDAMKARMAMVAQYVEELESELSDMQSENYNLYSDMSDIMSSSTWRILSPLRALVGWLRKNTVGRYYAYRQLQRKKKGPVALEMVAGLNKVGDSQYESVTRDPNFMHFWPLKKGWHRFSWSGDCVVPLMIRLYPDFGKGMGEGTARNLGWLDGEKHETLIYLEQDVKALRVDVGSIPTVFSLRCFKIRRISSMRLLFSKKLRREKLRFLNKDFQDLGMEDYDAWARRHEPGRDELREQRIASRKFAYRPLISILVPTYNTDRLMLEEMIQSVYAQTYDNWELCVADGGSSAPYLEETLRKYDRIVYRMLGENRGISGNSNAALALAKGEYVALLDHDDVLPSYALYELVKAINEHDRPDVLYSDEDKFEKDLKQRFEPHFKPDWSPDMLRSCNYICHLFVAKQELILKVGGFRPEYDGSQDYDLILRATEQANSVVHIPKVLYHWRCHPTSVAQASTAKPYAYENARKAIADHLHRMGRVAQVEHGVGYGFYRSIYQLESNPRVSVIVWDEGDLEKLERCLESLAGTSYRNYEIIVATAGGQNAAEADFYGKLADRGVGVVRGQDGKAGYSPINNAAAQQAKGDYLLFLTANAMVQSSNWLEEMLAYSLRDDVGVTGGKLYYPDGLVGHCGLVVGMERGAERAFEFMQEDQIGYSARTHIVQNVSAVSKDCLMVRRSVFQAAGGFGEGYALAFQGADLCLKVIALGYRTVFTPFAELCYQEWKAYRGDVDRTQQLILDLAEFRRVWQEYLQAEDPYYNPNLSMKLLYYLQ
ncbi:MAG: glycosyltransferase family 2 protein [Christensenellales bacterium]|jgi:GT2 family glycosyltransferase